MAAFSEDRRTVLYRVRCEILERQLGRSLESAAEERERLGRELAALSLALASARARPAEAFPSRWVAVTAAILSAAFTSFLMTRSPATTATMATRARSDHEERTSAPRSSWTTEIPAPPPPSTNELSPPAPPARARPSVTVRARPTGGEIVQAVRAARARMESCVAPSGRSARARLVFAGDSGRVVSADLTDSAELAEASAQRCILQELRRARVAPFANATQIVTVPFAL